MKVIQNVLVASACRTPVGKMGGALSTVSAVELGALAVREAVARAGIKPEYVDHVYMGNALQSGVGPNLARQVAIGAGLPKETTAVTVNILCGSGLDSVNEAARMIECGDADIVVAGGAENMSMAPYAALNARFGYRMGDGALVDTMLKDALIDAFHGYHMGVTAENIAEQWGLSREELDDFAVASHQKACRAIETGAFKEEIVPVAVKTRKGDVIVDTDEGPRAGVTMESMAKLKPAFKKGGVVTAGNSSSINDGAAAVVLISEEKAAQLGVKPMARWVAGALAGVDASIMGIGPVYATRKVMERNGWTIRDFDLIEANEAFAAQSLAVIRDLGIDRGRLNINGGAIAIGHPLGCSGARILTTLLYGMKRTGAKRGLATLCIGGGQGCATVVEMD